MAMSSPDSLPNIIRRIQSVTSTGDEDHEKETGNPYQYIMAHPPKGVKFPTGVHTPPRSLSRPSSRVSNSPKPSPRSQRLMHTASGASILKLDDDGRKEWDSSPLRPKTMEDRRSRSLSMPSQPRMTAPTPTGSPFTSPLPTRGSEFLVPPLSAQTAPPALVSPRTSTPEDTAVKTEAEMFFLRQEHRRRQELEQDVEEARQNLELEIRNHSSTATLLQGMKIELQKEKQSALREMTARRKSDSERDRAQLEKQIIEEEKNKLSGSKLTLEKELARERKVVAALSLEVKRLESELVPARAAKDEAETARARMTRYTERVRLECADTVKGVSTELETEKQSVKDLTAQNEALTTELNALKASLEHRETTLASAETEKIKITEEFTVNSQKLTELQTAHDALVQKLAETEKKLQDSSRQWEEIRNLHSREQSEHSETKSKLSEHEQSLQQLRTTEQVLTVERDGLKSQLPKYEQDLRTAQESNERMRDRIGDLEKALIMQEQKTTDFERNLLQLQTTHDSYKTEASAKIADLEAKLTALQQAFVKNDEDKRAALEAKVAASIIAEKAQSILKYEQDERHKIEAALAVSRSSLDRAEMSLQRALSLAYELGFDELAEHLIEAGCDVNATDKDGFSLLHNAAAQGKSDAVVKLIAKGAVVDAKNASGATPLHQAALNGFADIVLLLLESGADHSIAMDPKLMLTPLHLAVSQGQIEAVQVLLERHANPLAVDGQGQIPLHTAVLAGSEECVKELLANTKPGSFGQRDATGKTSLHLAALSGNIACAKILLEAKCTVNAADNTGKSPLHYAVTESSIEMIDLLIQNKADVSAKAAGGYTPMHLAAAAGRDDVINLLMRKKGSVNAASDTGETPLSFAAGNGHISTAKLLLDNKANVKVIDSTGCTPLFYAVEDAAMVQILLDKGSVVNVVNKEGDTPLHAACDSQRDGHEASVQLLISRGALVDAKNSNDATPLHSACVSNCLACVSTLLKSGASVASASKSGHTPLHAAMVTDNDQIIQMLLSHGADIFAEDSQGRTPSVYAAVARGDAVSPQGSPRAQSPVSYEARVPHTPEIIASLSQEESSSPSSPR